MDKNSFPLFEHATRTYLDWYRSEHGEHPETWRRAAVSFTALSRAFAHCAVASIGPCQIEAFKCDRRREVKPVTVRHDLHALSGFFQYAIVQGWCAVNPVRGVRIPSDREAVRVHVLDSAEEAAYLKAASSHPALHALARIMLATGMRPSEVLSLRTTDVDPDGKRVVGYFDFFSA